MGIPQQAGIGQLGLGGDPLAVAQGGDLVRALGLRHYDEQAQAYAVVPGEYELQVGASSADIRARTRLAVEQD